MLPICSGWRSTLHVRWRQRAVERYLLTLLYAASVAAGAAVLVAVMTQR